SDGAPGWGSTSVALTELEQAAALSPLDAGFQFQRAAALEGLGRLDEARQAALRGLELDQKNPDPPWALSFIAWDSGDPVAAIIWMMKAHRLEPGDQDHL